MSFTIKTHNDKKRITNLFVIIRFILLFNISFHLNRMILFINFSVCERKKNEIKRCCKIVFHHVKRPMLAGLCYWLLLKKYEQKISIRHLCLLYCFCCCIYLAYNFCFPLNFSLVILLHSNGVLDMFVYMHYIQNYYIYYLDVMLFRPIKKKLNYSLI